MSYLLPPPDPAPVVVVKDVGGYVNDYAAMTEIYRRTNREVRLHECRSACTMALSLPNVCVYPDSILKFHQAYDPRNHVANLGVSEQLFETYPPAVRARLGTLTRNYHVLRGSELISLGVRDCNSPAGPRIMVASASVRPLPESASGTGTFSALTGKLEGMMSVFKGPGQGQAPQTGAPAQPGEKPPVPSEFLRTQLPVPPTRPATIEVAKAEPEPAGTKPAETKPDETKPSEPVPMALAGAVPTPPEHPLTLVAYQPTLAPIPFMQRIGGSAPILPTKFVPFEKAKT